MSVGPDRRWLRPDVGLSVDHRDTTPAGGPIGRRIDDSVRAAFAPVMALVEAGHAPDGTEVLAAMAAAVADAPFAALAEVAGTAATPGGPPPGWQVRPDVLRPDPDGTAPSHLTFERDGGPAVDVALPPPLWAPVHRLVADLHAPGGVPAPGASTAGTGPPAAPPSPELQALLDALDREGMLQAEPPAPPHPDVTAPGITFVGHNAAVVRGDTGGVVLDPFLVPRRARYPEDFQPLVRTDLGPVDAILITHSHPDHVDPGSLLRFDPATPVVVPAVGSETILAMDFDQRLRQLGFTDVRPSPWGRSLRFGDVTVQVLPFYGEQPTDGPRLHPEVTNAGNTYLVATPHQRAAFVADAGADDRGSMVEVGRRAAADLGPVDVVFAGYRGWVTTPVELLGSSVARYVLFVPPDRWATRMALMHDADGALATADAFGAPVLVPYADGGAPWYWELGLGPRLDDQPAERDGFDPFPERVVRRAAEVGAPSAVVLLRPGDVLLPGGEVRTVPGHRFPWPPVPV